MPEIQFSDFITPAMDALTQQAAKLRYRSGGTQTCPFTLRVCYGGGVGGGLYHSQTNTTWFAHEPGLVVVAPGTVADAKDMLKAAIRQDDPVIYFEHKKLYRSIKEELPDGRRLCHRSLQRRGSPPGQRYDACHLWLDVAALSAGSRERSTPKRARRLRSSTCGSSIRSTKIRSSSHWQRPAACSSCMKIIKRWASARRSQQSRSSRLSNAWMRPIMRLTAPDVPAIPFSSPLEKFYLPSVDKIVEAATKLLNY